MKIIKFQSEPAQTPFALQYNLLMCEDKSDKDLKFFNKIKNIILKKESTVIEQTTKKYAEYNKTYNIIYDGETKLGKNSLTSRGNYYNFLKWDFKEIDELKKILRNKYNEFLLNIGVEQREVWIKCWANVMRYGEKIEKHIHSSNALTWIGGHVIIACEKTSTFYENPISQAEKNQTYESVNEVGQITFFQNNIPHYTNTHYGKSERITIAFDIIPEERYNQYSKEMQQNCIKF